MFEVGTFLAEHLHEIDPHPIYAGSISLLKSQGKAIQCLHNSHAVSLYMDGKVEACLGLMMLWDGNADVWTVTSKKVQNSPVAFHRTVLRLLNSYQDGLKLRRISAGTPSNFVDGCKWLETLGFVKEGKMIKYGPDGQDWWLYARLKEWEL